ncbi:MAG: hypothetical protein J7518_11815 [Nocardioidaceae bacterium]|nr:hypothetical protein [Nocardioidaceae bacterium]
MRAPSVLSLAVRLRLLIEENMARHGLVYPWWIPILSMVGLVGATTVSLTMRDWLWPPYVAAGLLALVLVPGILELIFGRHIKPVLETAGVFAVALVLLWNPVESTSTLDPAPALLAFLTAEVVARDGVRPGLIVGATSAGVIAAAAAGPGVHGLPVHLVDLALGFAVGYMLLWQMRALLAERAAREGERARATLAERERIGREIHDLVAHALSVTLLQITGARHALRDVQAGERDEVADIDEALADAERVGRQAMADIRQTVSTLATGPSATQALPTAADIGALVEQMGRAGLAIAYDEVGDPSRLADATGLGVYRIAQESLANIAKHAPAAAAQVQLTVTPTWARLQVRNPVNGVARAGEGPGSGLTGMRARAAQLGAQLAAGPDGEDWLVDLRLQLRERNGKLFCPVGRRVAW